MVAAEVAGSIPGIGILWVDSGITVDMDFPVEDSLQMIAACRDCLLALGDQGLDDIPGNRTRDLLREERQGLQRCYCTVRMPGTSWSWRCGESPRWKQLGRGEYWSSMWALVTVSWRQIPSFRHIRVGHVACGAGGACFAITHSGDV